MIKSMKKDPKKISDQMHRLYLAAKELKNVEGKSAVANLLNVTPQLLNHWENGRPISDGALLAAQFKIGCDAIWLRDGVGDMTRGDVSGLGISDLARLVALYEKLDLDRQKEILEFAQFALDHPRKNQRRSQNYK
jgi:hypothetical protein